MIFDPTNRSLVRAFVNKQLADIKIASLHENGPRIMEESRKAFSEYVGSLDPKISAVFCELYSEEMRAAEKEMGLDKVQDMEVGSVSVFVGLKAWHYALFVVLIIFLAAGVNSAFTKQAPEYAVSAVATHFYEMEIGGGWRFKEARAERGNIVVSITIPKKPPGFENIESARSFVRSSICPSAFNANLWRVIEGFDLELEFHGVQDNSYMLLPCPIPNSLPKAGGRKFG